MIILALFYIGLHLSAATTFAPCIELNDGKKIPILALGTGRGTAKDNESSQVVRDAVYWAIEAGYRHIDTAAVYGDEKEVGQGIQDAIDREIVTREQLFITTKLWNDHHAQDKVVPALKASLNRLGLDYVDLYLVHFPLAMMPDRSPDDIDYLETWQGMEEARELGLTRSIGVSNFNSTQIDRLVANSRVRPVVNEIEVNPTNTQEYLVHHCQLYGIAIMAYSPFGFLVSRKKDSSLPPRYDDPYLVSLGKKYGKSSGQIVLRYLVERGIIPIPKSTTQKRIVENISLFDFKLTPDEIDTIGKFNKNVRVYDFHEWKDYPNFPY